MRADEVPGGTPRRTTRTLLVDAAIALALMTIGVGVTSTANEWGVAERPIDALGLALVAATALSVAGRRRWPRVVLGVTTLTLTAYLAIGYAYGPVFFGFFVAVYTVARYLPLNRSVPAAAVAMVVEMSHLFLNSSGFGGFAGVFPASAWVVVPFAIGATVRLTREAAANARAEAVRDRVHDERLRVAQEVHDIVGHGLAAIKMQADVALHLLARKPEQAQTALEAISRTSSDALDELRATLAVVRRTAPEETRTPTPGLGRLEELRRRMDEAGLRVHLETSGQPRSLPTPVDLTGYRVVQESLTNVLRHAGAEHVTVAVRYDPDTVTIEIENPVNGVSAGGGGLGIPGMRERVLGLGGQFSAGPTDDGRFEVRACLPTGGHT